MASGPDTSGKCFMGWVFIVDISSTDFRYWTAAGLLRRTCAFQLNNNQFQDQICFVNFRFPISPNTESGLSDLCIPSLRPALSRRTPYQCHFLSPISRYSKNTSFYLCRNLSRSWRARMRVHPGLFGVRRLPIDCSEFNFYSKPTST